MGSYLSPLLLELGCRVTVASLEQETATRPGLRFLSGDFRDLENLDRLLADHYDAVIDFLNYSAEEYRRRCRRFLENTGHYIFLSSYRVYNGGNCRPGRRRPAFSTSATTRISAVPATTASKRRGTRIFCAPPECATGPLSARRSSSPG